MLLYEKSSSKTQLLYVSLVYNLDRLIADGVGYCAVVYVCS